MKKNSRCIVFFFGSHASVCLKPEAVYETKITNIKNTAEKPSANTFLWTNKRFLLTLFQLVLEFQFVHFCG